MVWTKAPGLGHNTTKLAVASLLFAISAAGAGFTTFATPGGLSAAPTHYGVLPANPPTDAPQPPEPQSPSDTDTDSSSDSDYYCGSCDGGGGGGGAGG